MSTDKKQHKRKRDSTGEPRASNTKRARKSFQGEAPTSAGLLVLPRATFEEAFVCLLCRTHTPERAHTVHFAHPDGPTCSAILCGECAPQVDRLQRRCPFCRSRPVATLTVALLPAFGDLREQARTNCTLCSTELPLGRLEKHLADECPHASVPCPLPGCTVEVPRRDLTEHLRLVRVHLAAATRALQERKERLAACGARLSRVAEATAFFERHAAAVEEYEHKVRPRLAEEPPAGAAPGLPACLPLVASYSVWRPHLPSALHIAEYCLLGGARASSRLFDDLSLDAVRHGIYLSKTLSVVPVTAGLLILVASLLCHTPDFRLARLGRLGDRLRRLADTPGSGSGSGSGSVFESLISLTEVALEAVQLRAGLQYSRTADELLLAIEPHLAALAGHPTAPYMPPYVRFLERWILGTLETSEERRLVAAELTLPFANVTADPEV